MPKIKLPTIPSATQRLVDPKIFYSELAINVIGALGTLMCEALTKRFEKKSSK
jgi:hypothetical protein